MRWISNFPLNLFGFLSSKKYSIFRHITSSAITTRTFPTSCSTTTRRWRAAAPRTWPSSRPRSSATWRSSASSPRRATTSQGKPNFWSQLKPFWRNNLKSFPTQFCSVSLSSSNSPFSLSIGSQLHLIVSFPDKGLVLLNLLISFCTEKEKS